MADNISDNTTISTGIVLVNNKKRGVVHDITGASAGLLFRFVAAGDFNTGDSFSISGAPTLLLDAEGDLVGRPWKAGDIVLLAKEGNTFRVLAPVRDKEKKRTVQKASLTPASGWTKYTNGTVTKNGDGFVHGTAYLHPSSDGVIAAGQHLVGTLPSGFRPGAGGTTLAPGVVRRAGEFSSSTVFLNLSAAGQLYLHVPTDMNYARQVYATLSYYASENE